MLKEKRGNGRIGKAGITGWRQVAMAEPRKATAERFSSTRRLRKGAAWKIEEEWGISKKKIDFIMPRHTPSPSPRRG